MNLDTILKLLYRNNLESVVTRAIQIESNIPFNHKIDDQLLVELTNSHLKDLGIKFKGDRSYGYLKCTIVGIDEYDLDRPYIVVLPDNSVKKVNGNSDRTEPTETITIPEEKMPSTL